MTVQAAPATGTPAPVPGATPPPAAGATPPAAFTAPWSAAQGMYKIGEGDAAKPWYEGIQEPEIKAYMEAKQYANPYEAAKAAWAANKLNNNAGDVLAVPPADADQKTMDAFYTKLGRPETADKYDLKMPEGIQVSEDMVKFGKEMAFGLGLNPKQAQAMSDMWNKYAATQSAAGLEAERQQNDAELTALTNTFGAELPKYQAAGVRAMQALGLSTQEVEKIEGAIGSAAIVNLLAKLGMKSAEGGFKSGETNSGDPNDVSNMNKEQAEAKIKALQSDVEFQKKYTDKNNPGNKDAVALMEKLFSRAN